VAKLRYQQTKVDGIDPTILVEHAVDLIVTQQRWPAATYPGIRPALTSPPSPSPAPLAPAPVVLLGPRACSV
jgi:hypothetical protein